MAAEPPDVGPQRRMFFALWPDAATTASVYHAARDVVRLAGGRATAKERLHVTVAFLGEVDEDELEQACSAVPAIKSPGAFDLLLDELGYWRESKILWLGPQVVPTPVKELEGRLWKRLIERGFKREPRDYRPHMTLARQAREVEAPPVAAVRWRVEELVLVESLSRGRNVHYEVLRRWPL